MDREKERRKGEVDERGMNIENNRKRAKEKGRGQKREEVGGNKNKRE
jgi:hypothetical protein